MTETTENELNSRDVGGFGSILSDNSADDNRDYRFQRDTYAAALKNIVSDPEMLGLVLKAGEDEAVAFYKDLRLATLYPKNILRAVGDSELMTNGLVGASVGLGKIWRKPGGLDEVKNQFNDKMFVMDGPEAVLKPYVAQDNLFGALFPEGSDPKNWPTIAVVANSNLATPQGLYDEMNASAEVVGKLRGTKVAVVSAFQSEGSTTKNAKKTIERKHAWQNDDEDKVMDDVSFASINLKDTIISGLCARDASGNIKTEEIEGPNERVRQHICLRSDAAEVIKHVVGCGYSGGFLDVNDALRLVQAELESGGYVKANGHDEYEVVGETQARLLMANAMVVGIAGLEVEKRGKQQDPWKAWNFVDVPNDTSIAAAGGNHVKKSPNTINIDSKTALDGNRFGGHGLEGLRNALMSDGATGIDALLKDRQSALLLRS